MSDDDWKGEGIIRNVRRHLPQQNRGEKNRQRILELFKSGHSPYEISGLTGISTTRIYTVLRNTENAH